MITSKRFNPGSSDRNSELFGNRKISEKFLISSLRQKVELGWRVT